MCGGGGRCGHPATNVSAWDEPSVARERGRARVSTREKERKGGEGGGVRGRKRERERDFGGATPYQGVPDATEFLRLYRAIYATGGAVQHEPAGPKRNHLARVRFPPALERSA